MPCLDGDDDDDDDNNDSPRAISLRATTTAVWYVQQQYYRTPPFPSSVILSFRDYFRASQNQHLMSVYFVGGVYFISSFVLRTHRAVKARRHRNPTTCRCLLLTPPDLCTQSRTSLLLADVQQTKTAAA